MNFLIMLELGCLKNPFQSRDRQQLVAALFHCTSCQKVGAKIPFGCRFSELGESSQRDTKIRFHFNRKDRIYHLFLDAAGFALKLSKDKQKRKKKREEEY